MQALDPLLRTGYFRNNLTLHQITGDVCAEQLFLPVEPVLQLEKPLVFAPVGGRPSNHALSFFNLQYCPSARP